MKKKILFFLLVPLIAIVGTAQAAQIQVSLAPGSRLSVEGKSTPHPFTIKASTIQTQMAIGAETGKTISADISSKNPVQLTVTIPIKALKSEYKLMDDNIQKAMKASEYPDIVFVLKSYTISGDAKTEKISALGSLSMSGKNQPITLNAKLKETSGSLIVYGEQPLSMADYGITPPTMMFGSVKVDNKVVIKYHLVLTSQNEAKANKN